MTSSQAPEPVELPMGKYLASSDKKTRDKAIKGLTAVLANSATEPLSKYEMAKLWKGLYFCFWMSDKPLVQQALALELADLLLVIPSSEAALEFLRGFWEMMVREWSNIDYLRIDKFYKLVRRFVNATFRLLDREAWDDALCQTYEAIMIGTGGPLCPTDSRVPSSLAYHLADIYVEELDKALSASTHNNAPLVQLISPFITLAALTNTNVTFKRIQAALIEPLLSALSPASSDDERQPKRQRVTHPSSHTYPNVVSKSSIRSSSAPSADNSASTPVGQANPVHNPQLEDIRRAVLRKIFEIGSLEDTRDANRKRLYTIWKSGMAEDGKQQGGEWDAS